MGLAEADANLGAIYLGAFHDRSEWTVAQHAAGLREVWRAGFDARGRTNLTALWVVRDTRSGARYPQPNKFIAEKVAEMHGFCEVLPPGAES
jgi:hypothetical protein